MCVRLCCVCACMCVGGWVCMRVRACVRVHICVHGHSRTGARLSRKPCRRHILIQPCNSPQHLCLSVSLSLCLSLSLHLFISVSLINTHTHSLSLAAALLSHLSATSLPERLPSPLLPSFPSLLPPLHFTTPAKKYLKAHSTHGQQFCTYIYGGTERGVKEGDMPGGRGRDARTEEEGCEGEV